MKQNTYIHKYTSYIYIVPTSISTSQSNCNCRRRTLCCPLNGECLSKSVIFKAEVRANGLETHENIGLASNSFKERYNNHTSSIKLAKHQNNTSLSKYIWELKNKKIPYNIKWSIISRGAAYHPATLTCHLCVILKKHLYSDQTTTTH